MAKKFFYNKVYNTRRTIINIVIIGICIIGIIVCFIITSNFQGEDHTTPEKTLNIKNEVTIEINQTYSKEIFFSKIENVDLLLALDEKNVELIKKRGTLLRKLKRKGLDPRSVKAFLRLLDYMEM